MSNDIPGSYPDQTSGWSGGESSRQRATNEDRAVTGKRQRAVHLLLTGRAQHGVTVREVEQVMNIGHGAASGALSRLHRAGHVVRLEEQRNRQQVYVLPRHTRGRKVVPYRPQKGIAFVGSTEVGRLTQIAADTAYVSGSPWHEEVRNVFEEQLHEWLADNKIEVVDDIT